MPQLHPALAVRAAVVATATAAAVSFSVLPSAPATPAPVFPAAPATAAPVVPAPVIPAPAVAPDGAPVVTAELVPVAAVTSARTTAMRNALSKIGAPYRWGAAGPTAFDCSGLVSWSFAQAGVALPRTSRAMSTVGTPVAKADLQPGDLVFFYRPVSHVGIYTGDGQIVHASNGRSPVTISDINRMRFTSARRI